MQVKGLYGSVSALALMLLIAPTMAQAQDITDSDSSLETVVVTGVRASMATSMQIKKNATQFVDSIVSEDIGKLPDNTIIDAMQHITGVQVQHASGAGETGTFLIHGLPDIATTLNGRHIFTTTGNSISLADIPAELLSRVDVHKSAEADDLEGGIAGLVNAVFRRPLDFDGLEIAGGLKGTYSSQSKHEDPDASFLFSNRWSTKYGDMGLLVDLNYNKRHYVDFDAFNYYFGSTSTLGSTTAMTPETLGAIEYPGSRERAGLNISAQWRPYEGLEFYSELFYTRYRNNNEVNYLIGLPGKGTGVSALTTVTDPDDNTILKTETASDTFQLTSNQAFRDKTDTWQFSTGFTYAGDDWSLDGEVYFTNSRYKRRGAIVDTSTNVPLMFDTNYNNSGTPNIEIDEDAANGTTYLNSVYHPAQFYDQWTHSSGSETSYKVHSNMGVHAFGIDSIDVGLRYGNQFGKNAASNGGVLSCYNSADSYSTSDTQYEQEVAAAKSEACGYTGDNTDGTAGTSAYWDVDITQLLPGIMSENKVPFLKGSTSWGVRRWKNANANYLFKHINKVREAFGQTSGAPEADLSNSFKDREISWAAYTKVNYDFDVGNMPLTGNIGVRVVDTRTNMHAYNYEVTQSDEVDTETGNYTYTKTYTPVVYRKDLVDWMPSFNAKLAVTDNMIVRFAVGRTITRPTFANLNPAKVLSNGGLTYAASGSSGNPNLSPVKSNNVDLGVEYYWGQQNSITGGVFYRQIIGYIQSATSDEVYDGTTYTMTKPMNSGQGYLQGLEAGYTQFFDFLPGYLSGLGLQANGNFIEGRTAESPTSSTKTPYTNVSKYSFNLVGIYEKGPISIRTAYNWRSSFLVAYTLTDATSVQPATAWAKPYGTLDFSASYKMDDEGLTFTIDATNLTNEIYRDTFGKGAYGKIYPRDTRAFDQTIQVGVRYRMN